MNHQSLRLFPFIVLLLYINKLAAQKTPAKTDFVFSAIKGTASKPDSFQLAGGFTVKPAGGDVEQFKISTNSKGQTNILFTPAGNFTGIARAQAAIVNSAGKTTSTLHLTGLSTAAWEGEHEAPLAQIVDALGYQINLGWTKLANHAKPEMQGDEIPFSLFTKAGSGKVEIIPVARYSPDFELPFGYYTNTASGPQKHEVGRLAKKEIYPEHQTLFPATASGKNSFDPGNSPFGFFATGNTHTAYSEDDWNMLLHPANAVHATRIYPVKDKRGKGLKNTYLLCFEEAKNGDYNDYVFLVKNIQPVTGDAYTSLFNGKNLQGWNMFLNKIGPNTDPNNNFRVEDGALHVIGKDLGYVITQQGYNNFHFKVDFKWGEKKWPPREAAKRDAGICYNIPLNEPDSIWPRSIECQIQEGDVGDFWLLGFTTITVDGKKNQPSNHTQIVKKADGEKPTGEWNTVEVISYNGKCVHIVNGVVVNVGEGASVTGGRVLLQSEYSEVFYKNVKIRKL